MPGFLLHQGATVQCAHAGTAQPVAVNPRVRVAGQPVLTQATTFVVAGCALATGGAPPCATGRFLAAATRLRSGGVPVLLAGQPSTVEPTGTPLAVLATQTRVRGS